MCKDRVPGNEINFMEQKKQRIQEWKSGLDSDEIWEMFTVGRLDGRTVGEAYIKVFLM